MIRRLLWCGFGRWLERMRTPGFRGSLRSYVERSRFAGWNMLYGDASVIDSTVGRFTYFSGGATRATDVGAFTSIGPDVRIGGLGRHPTDMVTTHPAFYSTLGQAGRSFVDADHFEEHVRTRIGSDVWIGARAMVIDGITIGDGAIVAAGSVVAKDVPPYAIVGGVPARVIRYRFAPPAIAALLAIQWWNWPVEELMAQSAMLRSDDPELLLRYAAANPQDR